MSIIYFYHSDMTSMVAIDDAGARGLKEWEALIGAGATFKVTMTSTIKLHQVGK